MERVNEALASTGLSKEGLWNYLEDYIALNLAPERIADDEIGSGLFHVGDRKEQLSKGQVVITSITSKIETCGAWLRVYMFEEKELIFSTRLEKVGGNWFQCRKFIDFVKDGKIHKLSTASQILDEYGTAYDISDETFNTPFRFAQRYFEIRYPQKVKATRAFSAYEPVQS